MSNEGYSNPYIIGPPVSGEGFYGREDVFEFVYDSLAAPTNRIVVLHGQRRIGKTSILQELYLHRLPSEEYCAVQIDVRDEAQTPFSLFVQDLAIQIAEVLEMKEPDLADYQENEDLFVEIFLPEVLTVLEDRRLVIMIDEFDTLANGEDSSLAIETDSTGACFLPMLQSILDDPAFNQLIFILIIGSMRKLRPDFAQFIRGARFKEIWLLPKTDTERLITKPVNGLLTYEKEAIDRIWYYTSGHPYFTQLLCYEVFSQAQRQKEFVVKATDIDQIIDTALERGKPAFVWLWDDLDIAERLVTSAIESAASKSGIAQKEDIQKILNEKRIRLSTIELVEAANHLVEEHVLEFVGRDAYRFAVELVQQWVKKNHNLNQEKLRISEMSRTATEFYKMARSSHEKGDLKAAIESYRLALQDNRNHFNAQLGLAQALWDKGDLEKAVDEFEDAYWLNEEASREGLVEARMTLAETLEKKSEQFIEAAVHYRRVRELMPNHRPLLEKLRVFYDKGEQARNRENWREATRFFEWVVNIDPDYEDAVRKRDMCEIKTIQPDSSPSRRKSLIYIIGGIIITLILLSSAWFFGERWPGLNTPTPTQAVIINNSPTTESTTEPTIESTEEPTQEPTRKPTEKPTTTIVESPTIEPELTPTEETTSEPTEPVTPEPTIEPSPTETPAFIVVIATPTDTPNPLPSYPQPKLISPPNFDPQSGLGHFAGRIPQPRLEWEAMPHLEWEAFPGGLGPNDFYTVTVWFRAARGVSYSGANVKNSFWDVDQRLYDEIGGPHRDFRWSVVISHFPEGTINSQGIIEPKGEGVEVSPRSEERIFRWD